MRDAAERLRLSARRYIYSVPVLRRAEWVLVDRRDPWVVSPDSAVLTRHPDVVSAFVSRLRESPAWHQVSDESGVVVFRRVAEGGCVTYLFFVLAARDYLTITGDVQLSALVNREAIRLCTLFFAKRFG